ncbi:5-deoxy-glucuronate isomerase [Candidatus Epulonipiscium viviparus]|uniref:5-deoxy-glucuronate isomerase n=1 Tax=Candidatus Epulonipiscium viviparus TaxID=420336 RepID=UPI00016C05D4|nr:5-deoxy-glucuronate isomerase [Candidatus Epulopiscium viviparus]
MKLKQDQPFAVGYNSITELDGKHSEMLMDYGILKLEAGTVFSDAKPLEKVFLLMYGEIEVTFNGETHVGKRSCYLNDDVWVLNVPKDVDVVITGLAADSEVAITRTENDIIFAPTIYTAENSVREIRGKGFMNEAGTRIVRTFMDKKLAPHSNIMIGEDVHYPGKWSGFPSHSHEQPEIYYYKFYPENGFGLLKLGDEGVLMEHNDTVKIEPNLVHPQVAAPGYAMYYVWVIRHLENNPYIKPTFEKEHLWVEQEGAKYWPEI